MRASKIEKKKKKKTKQTNKQTNSKQISENWQNLSPRRDQKISTSLVNLKQIEINLMAKIFMKTYKIEIWIEKKIVKQRLIESRTLFGCREKIREIERFSQQPNKKGKVIAKRERTDLYLIRGARERRRAMWRLKFPWSGEPILCDTTISFFLFFSFFFFFCWIKRRGGGDHVWLTPLSITIGVPR